MKAKRAGIALAATPVLILIGLLLLSLFVLPGAQSALACEATSGSSPVKAGTVPNGWGPLVDRAAKDSGVPASVIAAQLDTESGWNPKAVSPAGAGGLSQFIPSTWRLYGKGDPFDPANAIAAQGAYMKKLMQVVRPVAQRTGKPQVSLALAGYNAGEGAVLQYGGIPPFDETKQYVPKILALAEKYAQGGDGKAAITEPATSCSGTSVSNATVGGAGDDYPFPNAEYNAGNPLTGFAYRNCTDFAWFRVMQQKGITDRSKWSALRLSPGNAATWEAAWQRQGWTVSKTPKVGAVIWYAAFAGGTQQFGHVAVVKKILAGGKVLEEGYNYGNPPDGHYYTREISANFPSAYLYVPEGRIP